jgi:hypothetical protein
MANRVSVKVDISGFVARKKAYIEGLRNALTTDWDAIVQECVNDILSRTPDADTEFRYIQGYEGGFFFAGDIAGKRTHKRHQSAQADGPHGKIRKFGARRGMFEDTVSGDVSSKRQTYGYGAGERISFIRTPGMWLQSLVADPANRVVKDGSSNEYSIGLGVLSVLEDKSRFSWQNYSSRRGIGEQLHTSPYGLWSFFEYGKASSQKANFGKYKLKPYASPDGWYWQSHKFYPQKGMYSRFNAAIFVNAVRQRIDRVKF